MMQIHQRSTPYAGAFLIVVAAVDRVLLPVGGVPTHGARAPEFDHVLGALRHASLAPNVPYCKKIYISIKKT